MDLYDVQVGAWSHAEKKGFHKVQDEMPSWRHSIFTKLALITTEVAEATEEVRTALTSDDLSASGFGSELADIVIRVADLAHCTGVNLDEAVLSKMKVNRTRPHLHGGKSA